MEPPGDSGRNGEGSPVTGRHLRGSRRELIEVKHEDTLGTWQEQLWLAVQGGRRRDVDAIASLRPPAEVVLRHVTRSRYREVAEGDGGIRAETTETTYLDEPIPFPGSSTQTGYKPLPRLPRPGTWRGRKLLRKLLREPYRFEGSCLFWTGELGLLCLLEERGADTRDLGWMGVPLLVHAAERGRPDVVRFLVEKRGHSPNALRKDGLYTALHWAADLETARYLLERQADANARTLFGDSVLAQQLRRDHVPVVDYLLSLGEERASRAQLLHGLGAQPEMLRVLIRHGVRLDQPIKRQFGERHRPRPLQRVLRAGLDAYLRCEGAADREKVADRVVRCVELLLEAGVDPRVRDCANFLPYHLVKDALPDRGEPLRRRLDAELEAFDGPREESRRGPICTCGLNL